MERLMQLLADRPAVFAETIVAVIGLLVAAGVAVGDNLTAAIVAVVMSVSAMVAAYQSSKKTVPLERVIEYRDLDENLPS